MQILEIWIARGTFSSWYSGTDIIKYSYIAGKSAKP